MAGWSAHADPGFALAVVDEPVHSGRAALVLGPEASSDAQAGIPIGAAASTSQTMDIVAVWEPVLSFWYRSGAADADGPQGVHPSARFNVVLTLVTPGPGIGPPVTTTHILTPSLELGGWRHAWYPLASPGNALTGTVTVEFRLSGAGDSLLGTAYVDEVSLGRT
jgi:hypothetical protein